MSVCKISMKCLVCVCVLMYMWLFFFLCDDMYGMFVFINLCLLQIKIAGEFFLENVNDSNHTNMA